MGQDGEIRERREKAGREKDGREKVEGVWGEDEEDGAGGREAFDLDEIQQVGDVSLKDGRESGRSGEGGATEGRGNGEREKKDEGVWEQQEDEWAGGQEEEEEIDLLQISNTLG